MDQDELSIAQHLAESRLTEIRDLEKSLLETKQKLEAAEMERKSVPDAVVKDTTVYKSIQSNFSIVFTENTQLRSYLDEAKQLLVAVMSQHHNQVSMQSCIRMYVLMYMSFWTCAFVYTCMYVHMYIHTVYPEILVTFLIWRFGGQDQNRQISITKFT